MKQLKQIFFHINHHPLARRHKLKAYYRFFSWQLSQFFFPHEVIYPFAGRTKLVIKKGLTGATGNIYTGLHDFPEMSFLLHFLRKEDLFFDIGANVGSYSMLASGCVGTRTVAFEPVPSTFSWLLKNIEINGLQKKVNALNIGLGSEKSILHFTSSYDTVNHVISKHEIQKEKNFIEVEVDTLDAISSINGMPALIKIDVEGFETEVLRGMSESLKKEILKAIIIELNGNSERYGFDESWIHQYLTEHHFIPYEYKPYTRSLHLIEQAGSDNVIYIRDIDFVKDRILKAKKVKIFSESF